MLEKEAFALLTRRVWNMLSDNATFGADVSSAINKLKPKPFREKVARAVLRTMSKELGRTVTPAVSESGEDFVDTVALAYACMAENDRPPKFTSYTPRAFTEMLIIKFCTAYATLDESAPTDDVLPDCQVTLTIPTYSAEALSLRERIRKMPTAEFAQYSLPR